MKNFWSKILTGFATVVMVLALSANAQAAPLNGLPNVSLSNSGAGQTTTATISFTTATPVGSAGDPYGQISINFPAGFNIVDTAVANPSANLGTITEYGDAGQIFLFSFNQAGGLPAGSNVSFQLTGIVNPGVSGNYNLDISTWQNNGQSLVDGPTTSFDFSIQPRGPNQDNSSISPSGLNNLTVGTSTVITFSARDQFNNPSSNQDVAWSLDAGSQFSLSKTSGVTNASGQDSVTLTAPNQAGLTTTVEVRSGTVVNYVTFTTNFTSIPGNLHHFELSNISSPQTAGSFFDIFVTPYDQYNNVITNYNWDNGANRPNFSGLNSVGAWNPSYTFLSSSNGVATYRVTPYATQSGATITANLASANGISNSFDVNHNVVNSILLTPDPSTITTDQTQTYTVTAYDVYGNPWDVSGTAAYSIDAAAGGSWNGSIYNPEHAGTFTVTAQYQGYFDTAQLTVNSGSLHHIIINPDTEQTIQAGGSVQFTATGYDQFNNAITGLTFNWNNADANGLFSSTVASTYEVYAYLGAIQSTHVNVLVEPGDLHHIIIVPSNDQTITAGQTITFVAHSYDIYGNERSVDTFTWVATSGVDSGLFNQTTAGLYEVYAMSNGIPSNHVSVTVVHSTMVGLRIYPDNAHLATADETLAYTALAEDQYGNQWDVTGLTTFTTDDPAGGFSANVYEAGLVGSHSVTGSYNGFSDSTTVTIDGHGVVVSIQINPTSSTLTADQTQQFTVTAYDSDGNSWDATNDSIWTTTDSCGTVVNGLYNACRVGDWQVDVTYNGYANFADVNVSHLLILRPLDQ